MSPLRHRLAPLTLALLGLAAGAVIALTLQDSRTITPSNLDAVYVDPCYGLGELISTRTIIVTDESAADAKELGLTLTPGEEREVRECRKSPPERVTIDGPTGTVLDTVFSLIEARAYYEEHPETLPGNIAVEAGEQQAQEFFVPADVPRDLTAGCDRSWVTTTFEAVQAAMCHPLDWAVKYDSAGSGAVGGDTVDVGVLGLSTESHYTKCAAPTLVDVPSGAARVCSVPLTGHEGQSITHYGIALPNGRNIGINIQDGASAEDEALALRVAANVESLVSFVPLDVSLDLTAGCDSWWGTLSFDQVGVVMCYPGVSLAQRQLWTLRAHNPLMAAVGSDEAKVAVMAIGVASPHTQCASPAAVPVPTGTARVCVVDVSETRWVRAMYGVTLPNGRNIAVTIYDAARALDEANALRVAANVELAP